MKNINMANNHRPYFLWDYDLDDAKLRQILRSNDEFAKIWAVSRILESARFEDIWKYISLKEAKSIFPKLKLKPQVKEAWENAFSAWGYQA